MKKIFVIFVFFNILFTCKITSIANQKQLHILKANQSTTQLENLVILARTFGYIRYFYPGTEAQNTDWDSFLVDAINRTKDATSVESLCQLIEEVYLPVAPAFRIYPIGGNASSIPELLPGRGDITTKIYKWKHEGIEHDELRDYYKRKGQSNAYLSKVIEADAPYGMVPDGFRNPGEAIKRDIADLVTIEFPITLFGISKHTYPFPTVFNNFANMTDPLNDFDYLDENVWLTSVIVIWNTFEHFYPYFDVIDVNWSEVLNEVLEGVLGTSDFYERENYLQYLVGKLQDGHGSVIGYSSESGNVRYYPPFTVVKISDEIIVKDVNPDIQVDLNPGDRIISIDGVDIIEYYQEKEKYFSAATPQCLRYKVSRDLFRGEYLSTITLTVEEYATGITKQINVNRSDSWPDYVIEPENFRKIGANSYIINLDTITESEFIQKMNIFENADALIFDMRGYPSWNYVEYLTDEPMESLHMYVPIITEPDRDNWDWQSYEWGVLDRQGNISSIPRAILTDGQCISYCESLLSYVYSYNLGPTVGEGSAGTNGNINPFYVPTRHLIMWTGMKVLNQDLSQVHAVGYEPDYPVELTRQGIAEGRDEYLEFAINLLNITSVEKTDELSHEFALQQNYPNPFNPATRIKYSISESSNVELKIYDMLGREVKTVVDEFQSQGTYEAILNASELSSGMYIYKLSAGEQSEVKKMILLR